MVVIKATIVAHPGVSTQGVVLIPDLPSGPTAGAVRMHGHAHGTAAGAPHRGPDALHKCLFEFNNMDIITVSVW
jgi:hypothetical protein